MKNLFLILCLLPLTTFAKPPAKLRYSKDFIFEKVLELKRQTLKPEIPFRLFILKARLRLKSFKMPSKRSGG